METDVVPVGSYLDLEDPFETLSVKNSDKGSTKKQGCSLDGSESGELTDDSISEVAEEKMRELDHEKRKERSRVNSVWSTPRERDERTVRSMLDVPSEWDFGSPEEHRNLPRDIRGRSQPFLTDYDRKETMKPHVLRHAAMRLLSSGAHMLPDEMLRSALFEIIFLLHEHDKLLASRGQLIGSMNEMFTLEREMALELLNSLAACQSDVTLNAETQRLVGEVAERLGELVAIPGGTEDDEKENSEPQVPAPVVSPPLPSHPYAVPPPNTALPPPMHHLTRPPPTVFPPVVTVPDVSIPPPPVIPLSVAESAGFSIPPPTFNMKFPSMLHRPPPTLPMIPPRTSIGMRAPHSQGTQAPPTSSFRVGSSSFMTPPPVRSFNTKLPSFLTQPRPPMAPPSSILGSSAPSVGLPSEPRWMSHDNCSSSSSSRRGSLGSRPPHAPPTLPVKIEDPVPPTNWTSPRLLKKESDQQ